MKKWLYILLIIFFLSKFNLVFKYHDTRWDDSVYIGMGKSLFSNGEKGLWEKIRPIGLPVLFGIAWKLGLNLIVFSELISVFFGMGCIYIVYIIGEKLFNKKIGLISSIILSLSPVFYYYSSYGFSGIPSVFFALMSLYFFLDKKYFLTGLLSGISFLFRFPQGILLVIYIIVIFFKKKEKLFDFSIGWGIPVFCFLIFNVFMYRDMFLPFFSAIPHQSNIVYSVLNENLWSKLYNLFYYFVELIRQNILYIFAIFYIKNKKKILLPFLLFMIYFTYIINKQIRFMLIFLPYLALMSGYGIYNLFLKKQKTLYLALIIILTLPSLFTIYTQYQWRTNKVPKIHFLYTYFNDKQGTVLTMFPTPTAYSDVRFVPFYNNVEDAVKIYNQKNKEVDYILYSDEFYPCFDNQCLETRNNLFEKIKKNKLIFNISYGQNYYVYKT